MSKTDDIELEYFLGHGCHNTFIIIDNTKAGFAVDQMFAKISKLLLEKSCDDLIIINTNLQSATGYEMVILEPNLTYADFCGNGARLVGHFLFTRYPHLLPFTHIVSRLGRHRVTRLVNNHICIELPIAQFDVRGTKFISTPNAFCNNVITLNYDGAKISLYYVEAIEPHLVLLQQLPDEELNGIGEYINFKLNHIFPFGVHVNSCYEIASGEIFVRTYERSLFRITRSCGTGAISSAQAYNFIRASSGDVIVHTSGGTIDIKQSSNQDFLLMSGEATITSGPHRY